MPDSKVFDSWALLAWLLDQPAAARIETFLQQAEQGDDLELLMSWVNVGEVYYMASRKLDAAKAEEFLGSPVTRLAPSRCASAAANPSA